LLNFRSN